MLFLSNNLNNLDISLFISELTYGLLLKYPCRLFVGCT